MTGFFTALQYNLVSHPSIQTFEWNQSHTLGASPRFAALAVATYISATLSLSYAAKTHKLPAVSPTVLRRISAVHNLVLLVLSLLMSVGISVSSLPLPISHLFCFPNHVAPRGPLFFWANIFYFSKLLEFVDTLLIIFSSSSNRRLSFLHVYHHSVVVVMCYMWLYSSMSLFPIALFTNASVHVLMYAYYFLCAIGIRPRWKRVVTDCQIVQFLFSFAASGVMLYFHFTGAGCAGFGGWCFNAFFNASLLYLFLDFHGRNYANKKKNSTSDDGNSSKAH